MASLVNGSLEIGSFYIGVINKLKISFGLLGGIRYLVISFIMLLFAGAIGYKGYLQSSLILLLINTLAVIGSPAINIENTQMLLFLPILFLISFGGILVGVRKLTKL